MNNVVTLNQLLNVGNAIQDNATKNATTNNSFVVEDNNFYRVYIALLKDQTLIDNLKKYYDSIGLNYYLKAINVSDNTENIINNYELLLNNCDSSNYDMILSSMLKEIDSSNL